jgi:uracil-DNA glycosylase
LDVASETLEELVLRARACRKCRDAGERAPLRQEPRPLFQVSATARICIASQAPGIRAHNSGIPFDDPSGERLRAWMGVTREEFYDEARIAILPMGFCFPGLDAKGSDLPPRRECAATWRAEMLERLPRIDLILCIGRYAQSWHMPAARRARLDDTVKAWRTVLASSQGPAVLPLPHPSWRNSGWLKRNPWFEEELVPVLRAEVRRRLADGKMLARTGSGR